MHADYPLDAAAVLLVESDGTPEEVAAEMAEITRVLDGGGRHRDPRVEGRGAAAAVLVGAQGGVSRRRPHLARLLLHRRHDSARARCRACCARIERLVAASSACRCANVFHAGDGNLHPLILFDANSPATTERDRGVRRPHPRAVHRSRRHDHRRARRRRREARRDVRAVQRRPSSSASTAIKAAFDAQGAAQSRQGACRRSHAAPSSAACTCTAASCAHPELPRF